MVRKAGVNKKAPQSCRDCVRWKEIKDRVRINELMASAVTKLQKELEGQDFKPSMGDLFKLWQMEHELEQDDAKEIRVRWVEPTTEPKAQPKEESKKET